MFPTKFLWQGEKNSGNDVEPDILPPFLSILVRILWEYPENVPLPEMPGGHGVPDGNTGAVADLPASPFPFFPVGHAGSPFLSPEPAPKIRVISGLSQSRVGSAWPASPETGQTLYKNTYNKGG